MFTEMKKSAMPRLLELYKKRKQKRANTSVEHCLEVVRGMLKEAKYCFMITHGENGRMSTRLVQPIADLDNFNIWIGTNPNLRKVKELEKDNNITIAFESTKDDANLIIYGKARIEKSQELCNRYWKDEWMLFFSDGPGGRDYCVVCIEPEQIELMNFARDVVQEPFGLSPIVLVKAGDGWVSS